MAKPILSLKGRALRYLSMREHSRIELSRKLQRYAQEGDDIEALLNWLEAAKFLSQSRFSESLIHRRAARYGNQRIVLELQSHGIQGEALSSLKATLQADETERARAVWRRKFGDKAIDKNGRAKQARFLQQRGFSHPAIQAAMKFVGKTDEPFADEGAAGENDDT